jgi:maltooligosyltrehalose trehalohydrolase
MKWGYLFQGQRYKWQKQRRGSPALDLLPVQFVHYLESHDQVANSLRGRRVHHIASPAKVRAMTALLLLGPQTPMLFQGQEFGCSSPFYYFADHNPELANLVAKGRGAFMKQFASARCPESESLFCEPHLEQTFLASKIDFTERVKHEEVYLLHADLLKLRRTDPVLRRGCYREFEAAVLAADAFLLRFFNVQWGDRLLLVNFGKDLHFDPAPEPLLAPPEDSVWNMTWSSEDPRYGGTGTPPVDTEENWKIPGHAAVLLTANRSGAVSSKPTGELHANLTTTD